MNRFRHFWLSLSLVALGLPGCRPPLPPGMTTSTAGTSTAAEEPTAAQSSSSRCIEVVSSLSQIFDLQTLDLSTSVEDGVDGLNRWHRDCAPAVAIKDPIPKPLEKLFTGKDRESLLAVRYSAEDGEHLRSCLLMKAQAGFSAGEAENPREQIEHVFDYVVRTIERVDGSKLPPLTPYEVCITGRGTAADRAWLFAGILRQLKFDAVRLRPEGAAADDPGLIAVLLREQDQGRVYLFDARHSVAVRVGPKVSDRLATLDELTADPGLLDAYRQTVGETPWTGETLKTARVSLMGGRSVWSLRMMQLQPNYSGDRSLIVSDPLPDSDLGPGLLTRVLAGHAGWKAEALDLWMHEDSLLTSRAALNEEQKTALADLLSPRLAPMAIKFEDNRQAAVDAQGWIQFEPPARRAWRARLRELEGDFEKAKTEFLAVRGAAKDLKDKSHMKIADRIRKLHVRSAEDAWYFGGLCQFEQGRPIEARATFQRSLTLFPNSPWTAATTRHIALCQAEEGKFAEAVQTLQSLPKDDPMNAWSLVRIREWEAGVR